MKLYNGHWSNLQTDEQYSMVYNTYKIYKLIEGRFTGYREK